MKQCSTNVQTNEFSPRRYGVLRTSARVGTNGTQLTSSIGSDDTGKIFEWANAMYTAVTLEVLEYDFSDWHVGWLWIWLILLPVVIVTTSTGSSGNVLCIFLYIVCSCCARTEAVKGLS